MNKKILSAIVVVILVGAGIGVFVGYEITHKKSTNLPGMSVTALEPLNDLATYETGIIVSDMKALGLPVSLQQVTATESGSWTSPNATPQFVDLGWVPDWPDPIAQQMYPMTDYSNGGTFGANVAWTTNGTLNSSQALSVAFSSNKTLQSQEFTNLYHTFYDQYNYMWLPNPSTYFFVQPYINNFTYNAYENYFYNMMSYNTSYSQNGIKAPSSNNLTDVADGDSLAAPDFLDPSHGFYVQDGPLFSAVYQQLYELNGSNIDQTVPVLAKALPTTPANGVPFQNYSIPLRSGITFSTGTPVNASTVWFSLYRTIVMAQGVSVDNFGELLFSDSAYASTSPYSVPIGWMKDMWHEANVSATSGIKFPVSNNYSPLNMTNTEYAAKYLANMLSHYDPWANTTQANLISYANQAVAVPGYNTSVHKNGVLNLTINSEHPYPFLMSDLAEWWGNIADPIFVDANGGVTAGSYNTYIDEYGMPGTGPYKISSVGESFDTITLAKVSNYWGKNYWDSSTGTGIGDFPAVAQPAHIGTIIIEYTVGHDGRVSGFTDNTYQISVVSSTSISSITTSSSYKTLPLKSYFKNEGANPAVFYISMNNHKFPTNILDFREALWYSINETALMDYFAYNGTYLAQQYIGPASPEFTSLYNSATKGLAPESLNLKLAEHYLNLAGIQGKFYVTLPNGTVLGDTSLDTGSVFFNLPGMLTAANISGNLITAVVKLL